MIRYGDDIYFFRYVPPTEKGSEVSKSRRPNPPFPDAELWQCSVYYYWWLFLRDNADYLATCENDGVGPCAAVYQDFGDIRDDDFLRWWRTIGRELFCEPRGRVVFSTSERVNEQFYSAYINDMPVQIGFDDSADMEKVLAEAENIIKAHYRVGLLFRPNKASGALYPVFTKPMLESLHQHYVALLLSRQENAPKAHEIAKISGVYAKEGDGGVHWRKVAGNIGFREIKQAKNMAKYVAQGVFPVMTPEHEAEVPEHLQARDENSRNRRAEVTSGEFMVELGGARSKRAAATRNLE